MVNTFTSFTSIDLQKGRMTSLFLSIILMMLVSASVTAAQITVTVDRNPIMLSDSFQLTFTAAESPDDAPNFSPLEQNFDILNQQKNNQFSWVNGSTKKTIQWTLNVMAKQSGAIEIPEISFGDDTSKPLSITVIETTPLTVQSDDELYLEVEASPTHAYVQAQVLYTVRLYQRVNLAQATLSDPNLDNTVVEKLGDDIQYNTKVKGVTYLVTERNYALFPQQSGTMTIAPLVLTADVITNNPRSRVDSFFSTQKVQTKRVLSKAITLDVIPSPTNFKASYWLPAEQIELKEIWSNSELKVTVGEPITRTLTIHARGATSSQLPNLANTELSSQLKTYPDKAVLNDQNNAHGIISKREQKVAFIPSTVGNFELPAIDIPWFNTRTQQMETALLPAVTLIAIAADKTTTNNTSTEQNSSTTYTAIEVQSLQESSSEEKTSTAGIHSLWKWATFGFALAWLITLVFMFKFGSTKPKAKLEIDTQLTPTKLKDVTKELKKACINNQAPAAHKALMQWSTITYNTANLADLSHHCDDALQAELRKLNQALYAKELSEWDGSTLLNAIAAITVKQSNTTTVDDPLVPLNPSQR